MNELIDLGLMESSGGGGISAVCQVCPLSEDRNRSKREVPRLPGTLTLKSSMTQKKAVSNDACPTLLRVLIGVDLTAEVIEFPKYIRGASET
jgi:hypothetical protein